MFPKSWDPWEVCHKQQFWYYSESTRQNRTSFYPVFLTSAHLYPSWITGLGILLLRWETVPSWDHRPPWCWTERTFEKLSLGRINYGTEEYLEPAGGRNLKFKGTVVVISSDHIFKKKNMPDSQRYPWNLYLLLLQKPINESFPREIHGYIIHSWYDKGFKTTVVNPT